MARKATIRRRMERIWKITEMLNEVKVRKPYIKKVQSQKDAKCIKNFMKKIINGYKVI